jgi:hypothetical protein
VVFVIGIDPHKGSHSAAVLDAQEHLVGEVRVRAGAVNVTSWWHSRHGSNQALHIGAVVQIAHDTPGRAYYLRKQAEGKTRKEALRALKRRISDAVDRQLLADTTR